MAERQELVFAPLGGVGEIGMNLALYGLGDGAGATGSWSIVGVSFAGEEPARRRSDHAGHPLS